MALTQVRGNGISNMVNVDGQFTMPSQPAFLVQPTSNQTDFAINSDVTVVFGTEVFDIGSNFASNTFTAPVTGKYQLNVSLVLSELDSAAGFYQVKLITSNRSYIPTVDPDYGQDNAFDQITISVLADMDASDTAYVAIRQSGGTQQTDVLTNSHFSGCLVC
tara:strand:- start:64 stop:549 length:486 start_codon:yes stop_codon:yes gene_type:complete